MVFLKIFFIFFLNVNLCFGDHDIPKIVDINSMGWKISAGVPGYDSREIGHFLDKNKNKIIKLENGKDLLITQDFLDIYDTYTSINHSSVDQSIAFEVLHDDYKVLNDSGNLMIDSCVFTKFYYEQYPYLYVQYLLFEYEICKKNRNF